MTGRNRSKDQKVSTTPEDSRKPCGWPGCGEEGLYRAPVSPQNLRNYHWFCLDHVRAYNRSWNYYKGMTEEEVEADVRQDTVWNRPSWQWGGEGADAYSALNGQPIRDDLGSFCNSDQASDGPASNGRGGNNGCSSQHMALAVLDLSPPVTTKAVKARYKELVKRHHPDANGGNKESEEKFKQISQAYNTILESLTA
jgi:hypothetical protein